LYRYNPCGLLLYLDEVPQIFKSIITYKLTRSILYRAPAHIVLRSKNSQETLLISCNPNGGMIMYLWGTNFYFSRSYSFFINFVRDTQEILHCWDIFNLWITNDITQRVRKYDRFKFLLLELIKIQVFLVFTPFRLANIHFYAVQKWDLNFFGILSSVAW
jgi:hypothetical protein